MKNGLILLVLLFAFSGVLAQHAPGKVSVTVKRAHGSVVIDGELNEVDWKASDVATGFFLNFPVDTLAPEFQSEVRMLFDDHFLYFGVVCHDNAQHYVVQSLRRDFSWPLNDNFGIYVDPFNDYTNGFLFNFTPYGVQREGLIQNAAEANLDWDNKWYVEVTRHHDKWVAEVAIPFKTLRYNNLNREWNITFVRNDVKRNETSSWVATPQQYSSSSLAYSGKMFWEENPPKAGTNISLIPYVSAGTSRDAVKDEDDHTADAGFDAKVGLTPSLNLDLTFNPDFSQVEVDRQVINLTRFEVGFPERRQFFLENSDMFAGPGFPDTRPFFSRRIGLVADSNQNIVQVPIVYGARISGKLGKDWRIGVMNLQTGEKQSLGLPAQNYTVGVVQRQVFSRSNIGVIMVNKQSLGLGTYNPNKYYNESVLYRKITPTDTTVTFNEYNRVVGVDFNLFTDDNSWLGDFCYHHSFDALRNRNNGAFNSYLGYNSRHIRVAFAQSFIGKNFNPEAGFAPQLEQYPGYTTGFMNVEGILYPKGEAIVTMGQSFQVNYTTLPDWSLTDRVIELKYEFNFINTAELEFGFNNVYQKLPQSFNPISPEGDSVLLANTNYRWNVVGVEYSSDVRKLFNYSLGVNYGGFYNGNLLNMSGSLTYRYQPYGSFSVDFDYNDIRLPDEFGSARFFLAGPRLDLTFSNKVFLTTFVQYNDRRDNVNLNARFQWRFKPVSDLFIVYTENYLPENFKSKNRALIVKLTYWFNL